MFITQVNNHIL